jgi:hypothetical protein
MFLNDFLDENGLKMVTGSDCVKDQNYQTICASFVQLPSYKLRKIRTYIMIFLYYYFISENKCHSGGVLLCGLHGTCQQSYTPKRIIFCGTLQISFKRTSITDCFLGAHIWFSTTEEGEYKYTRARYVRSLHFVVKNGKER